MWKKLADARHVMQQLKIFWRTTKCTLPWKLRVFEAVVRAKLFYSMETLELTPTQQRQLDTFFYGALRRILKIPPTFIVRHWPNERVLSRARVLTSDPHHPERFKGPTPFGRKEKSCHVPRLGRGPAGLFQTELNGITRNYTDLDGIRRNAVHAVKTDYLDCIYLKCTWK